MKTKILLLLLLLAGVCLRAQWSPMGTQLPAFVVGYAPYNGTVLAYCYPSPQIYEWNGTDWVANLPPVPGAGGIHSLCIQGNTIYAAAYATQNTSYVSRYSNGTWTVLGGAFSNAGSNIVPTLYDIVFWDNSLYVCGEFNRIDGDTVNRIARWDGQAWQPLGTGLEQGMPPYTNLTYPHDMLGTGALLFVAGNFRMAGGQTVRGIASWDGGVWQPVDSGFNAAVYGMALYQGEVWAGGEFTQAGTANTPVRCLARLGQNGWENPGLEFATPPTGGAKPFVHTLYATGDSLWVAGGFDTVQVAGTDYLGSGVMLWEGTQADMLDGGLNGDAEALIPWGGGMLVGGDFTLAGGTVQVSNAALWGVPLAVSAPASLPLRVYPTQTDGRLQVENPGGQVCTYRVLNPAGQLLVTGICTDQILLPEMAAGVYLLEIQRSESEKAVFRILRQ